MTTFGVTPQGFVLKTRSDIEASVQAKLRSLIRADLNFGSDSLMSKLTDPFIDELGDAWEAQQETHFSAYPAKAEGVPLDDVGSVVGVTRLDSTESVATATIHGAFNTVLPIAREASVTGTGDRFKTDAAVTITDAHQRNTATIDELIVGALYRVTIDGTNEFDAIAASTDTKASLLLSIANQINASALRVVAVMDGEVLQVYAATAVDSFTIAVTATITYVIVGVDQGPKTFTLAGDVTAVFDATDPFVVANSTGNDGGYTVDSVAFIGGQTVVTTVEAIPDPTANGDITIAPDFVEASDDTFSTQAALTALVAGAIGAVSGTLAVIETPIDGWEGLFNFEDATQGRTIEEDTEYRVRRDQSLQIVGAATINAIRSGLRQVPGVDDAFVFENDKDVPDAAGRPPHSIEAVVVGGDDIAIATEILNKKAAGIDTTTTAAVPDQREIDVDDSQGIAHTIFFSRGTPVDIHMKINVTLDAEQGAYPVDGDTLVQEAVVAFGNDEFTIGRDVATWRLKNAVADIPGIGDIEILISRDDVGPVPPDTEQNIPITATEVADFDTSRTAVVSA